MGATTLRPKNELRNNVYNVPDRLSGLEELGELRRLCPGRQWNFVYNFFLSRHLAS